MNSKCNLSFVCFVINLIIVCNLSSKAHTLNASQLDRRVYFTYTGTMSSKDKYNLHHAFAFEYYKWNDSQIIFEIEKTFSDSERVKILSAISEIEKFSCIRFLGYNVSNGPDYVVIVKDNEYSPYFSSEVGCQHRGKQFLWLSADMIKDIDHRPTILHELLHTIGFDHHHQRSDRDKYIDIHVENINLTELEFLEKYAKIIEFDPKVKYVTPFDFNSVMLYGEYSDSINNKPVITSKIKGKKLPIFLRQGLSKRDKILLNRFYNCKTVDKTVDKTIDKKTNKILKENTTGKSKKTKEILKENTTDNSKKTNEILKENTTDKSKKTNEILQDNTTDNSKKSNEILKKNTTDNSKKTNEILKENTTDNSMKTNEILKKNTTDKSKKTNEILKDNTTDNSKKTNEILKKNTTDNSKKTNEILKENTTDNSHPACEVCFVNNSAAAMKWQGMAVPFMQYIILLISLENSANRFGFL